MKLVVDSCVGFDSLFDFMGIVSLVITINIENISSYSFVRTVL